MNHKYCHVNDELISIIERNIQPFIAPCCNSATYHSNLIKNQLNTDKSTILGVVHRQRSILTKERGKIKRRKVWLNTFLRKM